jgi:hypothetical protein
MHRREMRCTPELFWHAGMTTTLSSKPLVGAATMVRAAMQRSSKSGLHNGALCCRRAPLFCSCSDRCPREMKARVGNVCDGRSCDDQCSPQQRMAYLLHLLSEGYVLFCSWNGVPTLSASRVVCLTVRVLPLLTSSCSCESQPNVCDRHA